MTPDRPDESPDEGAEHGVLDHSGTLDTASISMLGGHIAQVNVDLPVAEDDDVDDTDVVEDEMPVIDAESRAFEVVGIVHVPDTDAMPPLTHVPDPVVTEPAPVVHDHVVEELPTGDIILEPHHEVTEAEVDADVRDADIVHEEHGGEDSPAATPPTEDAPVEDAHPHEADVEAPMTEDAVIDDSALEDADSDDTVSEDAGRAEAAPAVDRDTVLAEEPVAEEPVADVTAAEEPVVEEPVVEEPAAEVPAADVPVVEEPVVDVPAPAATGVIGTVPLTRREAHQADDAARSARVYASERIHTPGTDVTLTSKRLGEVDDARESSDLLTADRLLDPRQISRPEPEGLWQQLVYSVSRHRINLGDGRRARQRKDLDRRIAAPLAGAARFVPVLSRKGGVGKTTVTSLLGMALADARDDRVIAVDANPDRGTLADRVGRPNGRTVRDLVRAHDEVGGYGDVSSIVARDATRLDVLASDADPRVSEAFSDADYRQVADVAAHYYSIVLTDTGTGIVHSVMEATLELADALVVVAGLSVDEARLASETLTWLETNGYADRVRNAVVVLNNARPGAPLVRESELEAHFRTRVRAVIRLPYDAHIAAGSAIAFRELEPATRQAAREIAAAVVEGLRSPVAAA